MEQKEKQKETFAQGFSFYKFLWIFIIICIVGYVYETILGFFQIGHFASRQGMLLGPFIPVYGCGAVLFMLVIQKTDKAWLTFIVTGILGAGFEFLYSYLQEYIFGTVSWEYHEYFLNFQGRTSVVHALFWGALGVVFAKWVYPILSKGIEKIPRKIGVVLSWILILFFLYNVTITVLASWRQRERVYEIPQQDETDQFLDEHFPDKKLDDTYSNHKRVRP